MATESVSEPKTKRGELTRERLIDAAVEEFANVGFVQARVESITNRAGVGYGTFYQYFPNKQALLVQLAEQAYRSMRMPQDTPEMEELPRAELVYRHLFGFLERYAKNGRIFRVIDDSMAYDPEVSQRIYETQVLQAKHYAERMSRRGARYAPVGGDPYAVAQVINAMSYEVARRFVRTHETLNAAAREELERYARILTIMSMAAFSPSELAIPSDMLTMITTLTVAQDVAPRKRTSNARTKTRSASKSSKSTSLARAR